MLLAWLLDNWPKHLASIKVGETVTGGTYPPGSSLRTSIWAASKNFRKPDSPGVQEAATRKLATSNLGCQSSPLI